MKEKLIKAICRIDVKKASIITGVIGGILSTVSGVFSVLSVNKTAIETSAKVSSETTQEILNQALKGDN